MTTATKAIRVEKHGGPEVLKLSQVDLPKPSAGQALVRLHAAGLNFIDIYQRKGYYPVELPYTPGREGAGVVEAVGEGVTNVQAGDRVAYTHGLGSYADHSLVQADFLIKIPDSLSFEQGAAFPLQGMTAHYLLHEYRRIKSGETMLIHAAAGGMGLLLVQWAKHMGARVIGTVSTEEKAKLARQAGADEIVLYRDVNFAAEVNRLTAGKGVPLIIDGVGQSTFSKNFECLATHGHVVLFGSASGPADPLLPNSLQAKSHTVSGGSLFNWISTPEDLKPRAEAVLAGIKEGWLKLRIEHVLPLDQANEAHRLLEGRQSTGKIVLTT